MAGGTDVLVDLKTGRIEAEHLIHLGRIHGLRGVSNSPETGGVWIGALTTIADLENHPLLTGPYQIVREAAQEMAAPQIRNTATIGGNIAGAVPCADLPPVLGVLDAELALWSPQGRRTVAITDFFTGPRSTKRRDDEILVAIILPSPPPRFGAAYARLSLRDGNAIAVASVAASLALERNGTISAARVILGAVAPVPKPAPAAESMLLGRALSDAIDGAVMEAMAAAEPISDLRASAEYRRDMAGVLARRALSRAHSRAKEAHT